MSQQMFLKATGLYTNPNPLTTPEGAMSIAKNVVIDQDNVVTPRRGFSKFTYDFQNSAHRALKLISFQSQILSLRTGDLLAWYNSASGWTDLAGTFTAPTGALTVRTAQASSNLYLSTSTGIKALDAYTTVPYSAGQPKGLDLSATLSGATGFQANNTQVAYRVIWGRKDLNGNLVVGAPSQRAVIANASGGTRDVSITLSIPSTITVNDFVQVYRSAQSVTSTTEPNDELYLVYEVNPTAGEITARALTFIDKTPDSLFGATLYTSDSQEGLLASNEPPPLAKDIAFFKGSVFFANTTSKHRKFFTLISVGGATGVQLNDTITIAGQTYTAKAVEATASREFQLVTAGSPAQNIADTAASLIRCVNKNTSNTTVYAYSVTGYDDLPGKMLIEERALGGSSFALTVSARGAAYNPTLPTSGTTVSSSNDVKKNQLYFSKTNEPEAVPVTNYIECGSAFQDILKIVPLRDTLIVFSTGGIYRITGSGGDFTSELLDASVLIAPESVQVLANQVFALTNLGIVQVSDVSVQVLSRPLAIDLLRLQGADQTAFANISFGLAYETETKYILWTIKAAGDTFARQAFVFNLFTNTWTVWEKDVLCGVINPVTDRLVLGLAGSATVLDERKTFTFADHADEELTVTVSSVTGKDITLSSATGIEVGDLFYQSSVKYSKIVSILGNVLTVEDDRTFTAGTRQIFKQIQTSVEYNPLTAGNPGILKRWSDVVLMFKDLGFSSASVSFKSEISTSATDTMLVGVPEAGWGDAAWGDAPWGGGFTAKNLRTYVAKDKQICSQLTLGFKHNCAYSKFALSGVSVTVHLGSERVTK